MTQFTTSAKGYKPDKPYTEFPLFPHATKRWAKKIKGKTHYFGPWADPEGALQLYLDQKDDLHAGRTPRVRSDALTVRELVNRFLTAKKMLLDSGEIAPRTWQDYHATCDRIGKAFGLTRPVDDLASDDFEKLRAHFAETRRAVALGNEIQRVRTIFKYGFEAGLIDKPIRYGPAFRKPSKKVLRRLRNAKALRMFEADELRKLLDAAGVQLRAMILLGANCGFGNTDCGTLPLSALDLGGGWVIFPRPKTGVPRRCPLWRETVQALRKALDARATPKDAADADLVFITKYGARWVKDTPDNPLSKELTKLLKALGLEQTGRNFYALRHGFETIGGGARDQVAVDFIMGHARDDMASTYRERIEDTRLKVVTDHVHDWLFPPTGKSGRGYAKRKR
jgi:integrase